MSYDKNETLLLFFAKSFFVRYSYVQQNSHTQHSISFKYGHGMVW